MFISLGIVTISAIIIFIEMPKLLKNGEKKTTWAFFILLFLGTTLSIAKGLNVKIPNPLDWITILFKPFAEFLKAVLKY